MPSAVSSWASPTCTVVCSASGVMSNGHRYSFQVVMKTSTPSAAIAGRRRGRTTCHSTSYGRAPSSRAAAVSERGSVSTCCSSTSTASADEPSYGTISACGVRGCGWRACVPCPSSWSSPSVTGEPTPPRPISWTSPGKLRARESVTLVLVTASCVRGSELAELDIPGA